MVSFRAKDYATSASRVQYDLFGRKCNTNSKIAVKRFPILCAKL